MALESATYISDLVTTNPTSSDNLSQGDDHIRLLKSTLKTTFPNVSGAVTADHTELNKLDGLTASTAQLNYVTGVTSAIQTQLDAKANLGTSNTFTGNQAITGNLTVSGTISGGGVGAFPSGTRLLFQQTSAPTGWTKDTTHNNKALRIVNGTVGSGGTVAFTTAFASQAVSGTVGNTTATGTVSGTVGDTTLTINQIPAHSHDYVQRNLTGGATATGSTSVLGSTTTVQTTSVGGGLPHTHTFSGSFTGTAHNHPFTGTAIDLAVQYVDVIIAQKD